MSSTEAVNVQQTQRNQLQREMLLRQEIDNQLDKLVELAAKTVLRLKNDKMETSQLRNLLNVSLETESTEVVVNFVCYQIARNKDAWGSGVNDFGHTVITTIMDDIKSIAQHVVTSVSNKIAETEGQDLFSEAFARLVRLYLGYLHRTFYFLNKSGGEDKANAVNLLDRLSQGVSKSPQTGGDQ
jgi:poly-D-alanine transfer protein DltD